MGWNPQSPEEWAAFGRELAHFINGPEVRQYLPVNARGWSQGGCAVLAGALAQWLGKAGERVTVVRSGPGRTRLYDHIAVRYRAGEIDWYIDGNGVHRGEEAFKFAFYLFLRRIGTEANTRQLRVVEWKPQHESRGFMVCSSEPWRSLIVEELTKKFGKAVTAPRKG